MKTVRSVATSAPLRPDTYIYNILPINTKLASISSDDSLRLIDPPTLLVSDSTPGIHDGLTCLRACGDRGILTAGRDGIVKYSDLRSQHTSFDCAPDVKPPILSIACQEHHIATGTELTNSQATVTMWDARDTRAPLLHYVESHNDDVTDLSFHSSRPSCLLSGSTDGLVNLYDTTIIDEDDALTQVFNHGSSIAHTDFLSDDELFALSHDEIFSIYQFTDSHEDGISHSAHAFGDLRPQLQCEYIVDLVSSGSIGPVIGAGAYSSHHLDIVPLHRFSNWTLDIANALRLPGAHGEDVVRSICSSDDGDTIFTAGEDGLIKAWRSSEDLAKPTDISKAKDSENPDNKRKKYNSTSNDKRARFNPY